jgi:signal transduction histidine kinase
VAANAAKTRFLAAASHDLRQPLEAIGLLVSLVREQVAESSVRALIDKTDEAVAAMAYCLPFVMPLALASYAGVLMHRLVGALGAFEQSNQLLEARVAERTRERPAVDSGACASVRDDRQAVCQTREDERLIVSLAMPPCE